MCDLERIEKFKQIVASMVSAKKISKAIEVLMRVIVDVVYCAGSTIFVFDRNVLSDRSLLSNKLTL